MSSKSKSPKSVEPTVVIPIVKVSPIVSAYKRGIYQLKRQEKQLQERLQGNGEAVVPEAERIEKIDTAIAKTRTKALARKAEMQELRVRIQARIDKANAKIAEWQKHIADLTDKSEAMIQKGATRVAKLDALKSGKPADKKGIEKRLAEINEAIIVLEEQMEKALNTEK